MKKSGKFLTSAFVKSFAVFTLIFTAVGGGFEYMAFILKKFFVGIVTFCSEVCLIYETSQKNI